MSEETENENVTLLKGIQKLTEESPAFELLKDEEEPYLVADIQLSPEGEVP